MVADPILLLLCLICALMRFLFVASSRISWGNKGDMQQVREICVEKMYLVCDID